MSTTIAHLKSMSYDKRLPRMLAAADTAAARKRVARSIARCNPVRYGTTAADLTKIVRIKTGRRMA